MSNESRDFLEMAFHSIRCFSDNGRLEAHELARIVAIAERDGVVDDNERRVLGNILARIQPHEIDAAMQAKLAEIASKYGLQAPAAASAAALA